MKFSEIQTYEEMGFETPNGLILITRIDPIVCLEQEISFLYDFLFRGSSKTSDENSRAILLLIQRITVYEDFHYMIREMSDDRASDFAKTCDEILGKIKRLGPGLIEVWQSFVQSCEEIISPDLELRRIDLAFLSNLTVIHDFPSECEFESRDHKIIPSVP